LLLPGFLSAQSMVFEHGTLQEALTKASANGKVVFLDAYTVWCGPCKKMTANTFPDSTVGAFYNAHFVNIKIDMEKGEGVALARQYGIDLYPTLLFLDTEGKIMHRVAGFYGTKEFIELGQLALDPQHNLRSLLQRYRNGDRGSALLLELVHAKSAAYDSDAGRVANEYLKLQDDFATPQNMELIFKFVDDPFSEGFKYLTKNRSAFGTKYGEKEVSKRIDDLFESYLGQHPNMQLGEVQRLYGSCYPEKGERMASAYRMTYFRQKEDMDNFANAATDHYQKYPMEDADEMNEMASLFAMFLSKPEHLSQAETWANASIKTQENYYNMDTLARIYAKQGKKKQAIKTAEKALKLAAKSGDDASQTQSFLETLK
jgi:thiol-disulfide isomerase/thioredoxin